MLGKNLVERSLIVSDKFKALRTLIYAANTKMTPIKVIQEHCSEAKANQ